MATVKISALPAAAALVGPEDVPIVQGGATVRTSAADIAALAPAGPTLPLAITEGGSGQTTAQLALDAYFASVAKGVLMVGDGTHITAVPILADGDVLTLSAAAPHGMVFAPPAAAAIAIGGTVTGATAGYMLFVGAGPVLAQAAALQWDGVNAGIVVASPGWANGGIHLTGPSYDLKLNAGDAANITGGAFSVRIIPAAAGCASFSNGVTTVNILNGGDTITYGPGTPANWLAAPPTDVWIALDRVTQWIATNFPLLPSP
jgi:hypothetical protein